ncbi:MAG: esterase/lipase family protein [Polyangiaceae bacterium]|jgi:pimeloyl-ACP methyl ester carboxylesterase
MTDHVTVHEDVVVLVPGFLGFSVFGRFPYFADRVPASLAAVLREKWGRDVSVVPASTVPTGPLRNRIETLAAFIGRLQTLGGKRFHLVGHSTGGVDAQLLMTTAPFWGGDWSDDARAAREGVLSVVTISAPHYGTCLLDSTVAEFVSHPKVAGALPFLKATGPLFSLAFKDLSQIDTLLNVNTKQLPDAWRFVLSVMRHHELLDELKPAAMQSLRATVEPDPRAKVTCFATGADVQEGPGRKSDAFYKELNAFGHVDDREPTVPAVLDNVSRIADAPQSVWIRNPTTAPFQIEPGTNDGIVNTARQVLPGATLAGVVVADHADVLGDYDRFDLATDQPMNTGIFRSGADFGDDQFVELYRRVAAAMVTR